MYGVKYKYTSGNIAGEGVQYFDTRLLAEHFVANQATLESAGKHGVQGIKRAGEGLIFRTEFEKDIIKE